MDRIHSVDGLRILRTSAIDLISRRCFLEAQPLLIDLLTKSPGDIYLHWLLIQGFYDDGDAKDKWKLCDQTYLQFASSGDDVLVLKHAIQSFLTEKFDDAKLILAEAESLGIQHALMWHLRGQLELRAGNRITAKEMFLVGLAEDPEYLPLYQEVFTMDFDDGWFGFVDDSATTVSRFGNEIEKQFLEGAGIISNLKNRIGAVTAIKAAVELAQDEKYSDALMRLWPTLRDNRKNVAILRIFLHISSCNRWDGSMFRLVLPLLEYSLGRQRLGAGLRYYYASAWEEAEENFEGVDPEDSEIPFYIICRMVAQLEIATISAQGYVAAAERARKLLDLQPWNVFLHWQAARFFFMARHFDKILALPSLRHDSERCARDFEVKGPEYLTQLRFYRTQALLKLGRIDETKEEWERARDRPMKHPLDLLSGALLMIRTEKDAEARRYLLRLVTSDHTALALCDDESRDSIIQLGIRTKDTVSYGVHFASIFFRSCSAEAGIYLSELVDLARKFPKQLHAWKTVAEQSVRVDNFDILIEALKRPIVLESDQNLHIWIIIRLASVGDRDSIRSMGERLDRSTFVGLLEKALEYRAMHRSEARVIAEELDHFSPENPAVAVYRAVDETLDTNDPTSEVLIDSSPLNIDAKLTIATRDLRNGDSEACRSILHELIELGVQDRRVAALYSLALLKEGRN